MKQLILLTCSIFFCFSCTKKALYNDPIPKHISFTIASKHVAEDRVINIWLPKNYESTNEQYPVIYMADGGIKEDFPHIANTLEKLTLSKKIPDCILVGIENTERGRDLTGPSTVKEHEKYGIPMTDGSANFRAFITDELVSEVNKRYRTSNKKGILGESLSGLFVMETFFLQPDAFDFYIAMDPSLWWNDNYLVKNAESFLEKLPSSGTKLWFAGSDAKDISKYTNQLSGKLEQLKPPTLKWTYSDEPKEQHSTIFRATKEKALIWTLNEM